MRKHFTLTNHKKSNYNVKINSKTSFEITLQVFASSFSYLYGRIVDSKLFRLCNFDGTQPYSRLDQSRTILLGWTVLNHLGCAEPDLLWTVWCLWTIK